LWIAALSFFFVVGYEPEAPLAQLHSIPFNSFKLNSISAALLFLCFIEEKKRVDKFVEFIKTIKG